MVGPQNLCKYRTRLGGVFVLCERAEIQDVAKIERYRYRGSERLTSPGATSDHKIPESRRRL